jgi:hypothetical protein
VFKITNLSNNIAQPTWNYQTTDTSDIVDQPGYFNKAWMNVERGEKIEVLADFSGDNLSVGVFYVVHVSSDEVEVRRYGDWLDLGPKKQEPKWSDKEAEIVAAIRKLDPKEHFTAIGKPDRRFLNSELGWAVEPDDLDRVWSTMVAEQEAA